MRDISRRGAALRLIFSAVLFGLPLAGCGSVMDRYAVTDSGGATGAALSYMNAARQTAGLPAASVDPKLEQAALQQARYMAAVGRMTHDTGRGRDFVSRKQANDIEGTAAENVAVAYSSPDVGHAMKMWLDSPPHRRNMLDARFSRFGVASALNGEGRRYWAMVLGE